MRKLLWLIPIVLAVVAAGELYLLARPDYLRKLKGQRSEDSQMGAATPTPAPAKFIVANREGSVSEVQNSKGIVLEWKSGDSLLTAAVEGSRVEYSILFQTRVMIPPGNAGKEAGRYSITPESPHWETAFCAGDSVLLAIDGDGQLQSVMNMGQRTCGIEGEME